MDPWQRQILADIGIATWIPRDQMPAALENELPTSVGAPTGQDLRHNPALADTSSSAPKPAAGAVSSGSLAALADSLDSGSAGGGRASRVSRDSPAAAPAPNREAAVTTSLVRYPEVACLWSGDAVLFCPPTELHGQVRLVKDILASASNSWTQATEQVVFRWADLQASGFDPSEAERSLLAFAEKRIEVSSARWVMCTPLLHPLLQQLGLPSGARLLGLVQLASLARDAKLKAQLWQSLQVIGEASP